MSKRTRKHTTLERHTDIRTVFSTTVGDFRPFRVLLRVQPVMQHAYCTVRRERPLARKRALPGARDASELPSRKVHPHLFNIIIVSPSSPSHHYFHFIFTQLALPKHVYLDRKPNTATLTAPCAFPFGPGLLFDPSALASPTTSSLPTLYIRDIFATKILVLNLFAAGLDPAHWHRRRRLRCRAEYILQRPLYISPSYSSFGSLSTTSYPCHVGSCQLTTLPLSFHRNARTNSNVDSFQFLFCLLHQYYS